MTSHVPETAGHDAENTGHALPKYPLGGRTAMPGLVEMEGAYRMGAPRHFIST